jgi:thioredoxin 1
MAEGVNELTDAQFDEEVLKSDQPVLVDFWAPWCGPCRMMAPVLEEVAKEWAGKVKVCKMNVDEQQSVARSLDIQSIPTIILFKDGKPAKRLVGARPKAAFMEEFKDII